MKGGRERGIEGRKEGGGKKDEWNEGGERIKGCERGRVVVSESVNQIHMYIGWYTA